ERSGIDALAAERCEAAGTVGVRERDPSPVLLDPCSAGRLRVAVERVEDDVVARERGAVLPEPEAHDGAQRTREIAYATLVVRIVDRDGLLAAATAQRIEIETRHLAVVAQETQRDCACAPRRGDQEEGGAEEHGGPHPPWTSH